METISILQVSKFASLIWYFEPVIFQVDFWEMPSMVYCVIYAGMISDQTGKKWENLVWGRKKREGNLFQKSIVKKSNYENNIQIYIACGLKRRGDRILQKERG